MPIHPLTRLAAAGALVTGLVVAPASVSIAAPVAPSATIYKNCSAIRSVWSGGIAREGVTYNTTHWQGKTHHRALKGKVKFSTALYNANKKSDADKDGIACEKS